MENKAKLYNILSALGGGNTEQGAMHAIRGSQAGSTRTGTLHSSATSTGTNRGKGWKSVREAIVRGRFNHWPTSETAANFIDKIVACNAITGLLFTFISSFIWQPIHHRRAVYSFRNVTNPCQIQWDGKHGIAIFGLVDKLRLQRFVVCCCWKSGCLFYVITHLGISLIFGFIQQSLLIWVR